MRVYEYSSFTAAAAVSIVSMQFAGLPRPVLLQASSADPGLCSRGVESRFRFRIQTPRHGGGGCPKCNLNPEISKRRFLLTTPMVFTVKSGADPDPKLEV